MKLSRTIKKELKKQILHKIDSSWKSSKLKIIGVQKNSRYKNINATHRGLTVTSYSLNQ